MSVSSSRKYLKISCFIVGQIFFYFIKFSGHFIHLFRCVEVLGLVPVTGFSKVKTCQRCLDNDGLFHTTYTEPSGAYKEACSSSLLQQLFLSQG